MKSIIEYIDDLKDKSGSDYKSAKMLNIDRASLSMIRKRGKIADETAIKIAEVLKIDEQEILIAAAIARSHGAVREAWEKISRRAGIAASFLLGFQVLTEIALFFDKYFVYYVKSRHVKNSP